jgi:glycerol-3-phosphate dehydrogenase
MIQELERGGFDLLVIGGGATGCGVALDAASRGLRCALVEREDFGSGSSSRSTKLVHGGVRYLEQAVRRLDRAQFRLVREALRERSILLRNAPHLTAWLPLFLPFYRWRDLPYYGAGLKLYDLLAGGAAAAPSRYLSARESGRRFPGVRAEGLRGGMQYLDGQFDDARLNLALALTAIDHDAAVANYVEVVGFAQQGGKTAAAVVRDRLGEATWEIEARAIVNACGPWSDQLRRLERSDEDALLQVSSGAHLVVDRSFWPSEAGLLIPRTEDGRVLFVLPWLGHTLIGTTEEPGSPEVAPAAGEQAIAYLLRHANLVLSRPVTRADVKAAWAGLRPLVGAPGRGGTAALARDHLIVHSPGGMITITGGKWTTYRRMAEEAVDYAVQQAGLAAAGPCRTADLPLAGAGGHATAGADGGSWSAGLEPEVARHLRRAYGGRAEQVLAQGSTGRLAPGHPMIEAEVTWAARQELAQTALDVLARRTRLAFLDQSAAKAALPRVIDLLAREFGWDEQRRARELAEAGERIERGL